MESYSKQELSLTDIMDEANTFMFEGHDTVGTNVVFCLHMLSQHPEHLARVQTELDTILTEPDTPVQYEHLRQMKHLETCIKETLRLFPSIPVMSRQLQGTEDVIIDGHTVPPGTNVIMLNYHLHRDESLFNNPNSFIPDRFLQSKQNYSYVPFSAGPRNCIGQK